MNCLERFFSWASALSKNKKSDQNKKSKASHARNNQNNYQQKEIFYDENLLYDPKTNIETKQKSIESPHNQPNEASVIETTKSNYIAADIDKPIHQLNFILHQFEQKLWHQYIQHELIAEGTFSKVYRAKNLLNSQIYALKKYKTNLNNDEWNVLEMAKREITVLQYLKKQNKYYQVGLIDYQFDIQEGDYLIVLEYFPFTLRQAMQIYDYSQQQKKQIITQIVKGVDQIHSLNLLHNDLKPDNILINNLLEVKIGDFASTIFLDGFSQNEIIKGNLWYDSPEKLENKRKISTNSDLWSLGIVISEIFCQKLFFKQETTEKQILYIKQSLRINQQVNRSQLQIKELSTLFQELQSNQIQILVNLLKYAPQRRLKCSQLLNLCYFLKEQAFRQLKEATIQDNTIEIQTE